MSGPTADDTHSAELGGEKVFFGVGTMHEVLGDLTRRHKGAGVPTIAALAEEGEAPAPPVPNTCVRPRAPSPSIAVGGRDVPYESWSSAERLAYLEGWTQATLGGSPLRDGRSPAHYDLGVVDARAMRARKAA